MSQIHRPTVSEINAMNNATLKTTLKEIVKEIEDNQRKNDNLDTDSANTTQSLLQQILDEIKKFNNEREEIRKDISELKKTNASLLQIVNQQQRFLEDLDAEKRSCNLIILGVDEESENEGATNNDDNSIVKDIIEATGANDVDINSMFRLGRRGPVNSRPRPIKIVVSSAVDSQKILSNTKKLKEDKRFEKVFVKRDVHPAIRKEMGRLFEAEKAEKSKPENVGREVNFDRKKRILTVDGVVIDRFRPSYFF